MHEDDGGPPWLGDVSNWDEDIAETLRGAYVIVGVTYLHADGALDAKVQMHGRVQEVSAERGVAIALEGARSGEIYWLPPDLGAFEAASPGDYRLRSTGEVIVDPDYTSTWTITRPPQT